MCKQGRGHPVYKWNLAEKPDHMQMQIVGHHTCPPYLCCCCTPVGKEATSFKVEPIHPTSWQRDASVTPVVPEAGPPPPPRDAFMEDGTVPPPTTENLNQVIQKIRIMSRSTGWLLVHVPFNDFFCCGRTFCWDLSSVFGIVNLSCHRELTAIDRIFRDSRQCMRPDAVASFFTSNIHGGDVSFFVVCAIAQALPVSLSKPWNHLQLLADLSVDF
ncbi:hypothetical protein GOP47_0023743 [Adiantum capillus-veneris]|uniref:Uncharacterized protein n=1 Tax=Adiantum capillus-veneris TaxID=13818 RepID=A0A9D4Z3N0_ADICA|nr:hypothetical protein GOP47_0023743 [Adiantum capillus-veneris]